MTYVFRRSTENLNGVHLGVDAGMLSVAVMPRTSLAAKGEDYVRSCCIVLPLYPGESVGVERGEHDNLATIDVSHGSDLCVPGDTGEEWVLVMGDPCYYLDGEYGEDGDYGRACSVALSEDGGFIDLDGAGRAFVTGTVRGDGTYPIIARPGSFSLLLENAKDEDEDDGWDDEDEDDGWESEDADDADDSDCDFAEDDSDEDDE